jgi:hypothetical protein
VRETDAVGNPRCDPDRPVGPRGDDPVDVPRPGETVDSLLVLGRQDRAVVGEREADRVRIPVDREDVHVAARPRGLEEAELGGTCA